MKPAKEKESVSESDHNPYASPNAEALVEIAPGVDTFAWYKTPTRGGLIGGAFVGVIVCLIFFVSAIFFERESAVNFLVVLPLLMLVYAIFFAIFGGISGMLVGLIAVSVRRFHWRALVHLLVCATIPPLVFAGPVMLGAASLSGSRFQVFITGSLVLGLGVGDYLYVGLHRLSNRHGTALQ